MWESQYLKKHHFWTFEHIWCLMSVVIHFHKGHFHSLRILGSLYNPPNSHLYLHNYVWEANSHAATLSYIWNEKINSKALISTVLHCFDFYIFKLGIRLQTKSCRWTFYLVFFLPYNGFQSVSVNFYQISLQLRHFSKVNRDSLIVSTFKIFLITDIQKCTVIQVLS